MPATLEHIRLISEHNERMPAKSTYADGFLQTMQTIQNAGHAHDDARNSKRWDDRFPFRSLPSAVA